MVEIATDNPTARLLTLVDEFTLAARKVANPEIDYDALFRQKGVCPLIPKLQDVASCNEEEAMAMAAIESLVMQVTDVFLKEDQLMQEAFQKIQFMLIQHCDLAVPGLIRKFGIDRVSGMISPGMRETDTIMQLTDKGLNNLKRIAEYRPGS